MQDNITTNSGLFFSEDPRDINFQFKNVLYEKPVILTKNWWDDGWWGNQGNTTQCVAYSWIHLFEDGPVVQNAIPNRRKPLMKPSDFYNECRKIDGLPDNAPGTTIHAAANVAKRLNLIYEYRWTNNINEIIDALLIFGPVIAATYWFSDMNNVKHSSLTISPTGRNLGGHAYVLNGVDTINETIRIKNSYGKEWGNKGHALISFKDMEYLMKNGGTVCIPFEQKVTTPIVF